MKTILRDYSQTTKQDAENIHDAGISDENRELFKHALSEGVEAKICKMTNDIEMPTLNRRYKKRMNRLFRERVGGTFLPFSKEDNLFEAR